MFIYKLAIAMYFRKISSQCLILLHNFPANNIERKLSGRKQKTGEILSRNLMFGGDKIERYTKSIDNKRRMSENITTKIV